MVKNKKTIQFIGVDCILMVILTLLDQWTKSLVVHHLKDQSDIILIPGNFPVALSRKTVELRSAFCRIRELFLLYSDDYLSGCGILVFASLPKTGRYTLLHIIASVLTAGALGNFIDRLRLGYVVDFFYFSLINFPVFNVADIFVVISFIGIAVSILFIYKDDEFEFLSIRKKESKA